MSRTVSRAGGTTAYKEGVLKRPLDIVNVFSLGPSGGSGDNNSYVQRLWLQGLSPNLSVVATFALAGQGNRDMPTYPALPGSVRCTPYTMTTSGQVLFQKPLTLVPETLPAAFGFGPGMRIGSDGANPENGTNLCDGCAFDVMLDASQYNNTNINGNIICAVTAHYTGSWWDIDAIENLLGYLNIINTDPKFIQTGGL